MNEISNYLTLSLSILRLPYWISVGIGSSKTSLLHSKHMSNT